MSLQVVRNLPSQPLSSDPLPLRAGGAGRLRVAIFCHSIISDWNHGNAHFLRGVVRELQRRGHQVLVYEPRDSWSLHNLLVEGGAEAVTSYHRAFPDIRSKRYDLRSFQLEQELEKCDLVLVHEWNEPEVVARIGQHRKTTGGYHLLFHDTHHRCITNPAEINRYDLSGYDGVLAFGELLRNCYMERGLAQRAWTWHEAADTVLFYPKPGFTKGGDLVWIGNWGDEERTAELHEFLLEPVKELRLTSAVHGVRYPAEAVAQLQSCGIQYGGWVANHRVPDIFAQYRVTVHIPRRPYVSVLKGIPTIRPFEAMACGIPLICAPWEDSEHLFRPGADYLIARNGAEMKYHLRTVLNEPALAAGLARNGLETIHKAHTCAHRVDELLGIVAELRQTSLQRAVPA